MERALEKLARQLLSFDEASLLGLWETYYERVQRFEPTRRWEEAVLVLSLIQAVHWKNLLFNTKWAEEKSSPPEGEHPEPPGDEQRPPGSSQKPDQVKGHMETGKVIRFPNLDTDKNDE